MAQKLIVALYLVIIGVRIAMKLRQTHDLHWLLTMAMEDGMSIFSFCMGVLFFHHKGLDGARAMSSAAVQSDGPMSSMMPTESGSQKYIRLFYFAL
eukprot:CAMPEP_0194486262 /NCGR_PEP_ID=MMETSP0253-20130528/6987_1 /TAXON_ID=2966 /ORGANISM="Noctiluca scintillans" /LENGTH=95 /DNA_ID=CAMNT_0039326335 /DNA_START=89 /DNA_END=376 /DNA_ORIENTATION=-